MKTLKLRVVHRILTQGLLDEYGKAGHSLSDLNKLLKVADKLAFKEEETKELNLRLEAPEGVLPSWKWNQKAEDGTEVDVEREIELMDEQFDLLKAVFKKKNDDKSFTTENIGPILEVAEQLGVDL